MDRGSDDDDALTLRAPRSGVAFLVALLAHVVVVAVLALLPDPKPEPKRISITLQKPPPPKPPATSPAPASAPPPPPPRPRVASKPAPATSPVLPELPPSEDPPENRAQLPVVETSPSPAPPPEPVPSTWKDRLMASLATSAPKAPSGVLAPSFRTLQRVADNDAKLHDEENEQRLVADFGPFFRRGIEALRGRWHPEEVLREDAQRDTRRCAKQMRTTWAVAVIDKAGNVVDVDLKRGSGCPQLDVEAIEAFRRVAQFPHPPEGLFVLPDGTPSETARYPVRFIVTFDGGLRLDWR
ncbi:MAG: energy transducer TonB [Deltaproteobacteria bacterium]|nr:energy transducer TonB [Deltaproteobacteria bacterium]